MAEVNRWRRLRLSYGGRIQRFVAVMSGLSVVLAVILFALPCKGGESSSVERVVRTRAEVEALIKEVGGTAPEWWDEVELRYPPTLDLSWPLGAQQPWNAQKNVGQYLWDVVNPNPGRWREGIKLVHHLMIKNKNNKAKLLRSMQTLGNMFHNLTENWARAAFWWRMAKKKGGRVDYVRLARCYWKLGSKKMAVELISQIPNDPTRHGRLIKFWADMGEYDKAIRFAELKAKRGMPTVAYLAAGDVCRLAGRYGKAISYYQKALSVRPRRGQKNDFKRDRERARASIRAIRLFATLDMKRVADGTYRANSIAFAGQLYVEVKVKSGLIESVVVTKHSEKQFYSALTDTPKQIVAKQGVKGVDAVTGATMTSEAIINATAKALAGGMK